MYQTTFLKCSYKEGGLAKEEIALCTALLALERQTLSMKKGCGGDRYQMQEECKEQAYLEGEM
jgi:hypothetical protein